MPLLNLKCLSGNAVAFCLVLLFYGADTYLVYETVAKDWKKIISVYGTPSVYLSYLVMFNKIDSTVVTPLVFLTKKKYSASLLKGILTGLHTSYMGIIVLMILFYFFGISVYNVLIPASYFHFKFVLDAVALNFSILNSKSIGKIFFLFLLRFFLLLLSIFYLEKLVPLFILLLAALATSSLLTNVKSCNASQLFGTNYVFLSILKTVAVKLLYLTDLFIIANYIPHDCFYEDYIKQVTVIAKVRQVPIKFSKAALILDESKTGVIAGVNMLYFSIVFFFVCLNVVVFKKLGILNMLGAINLLGIYMFCIAKFFLIKAGRLNYFAYSQVLLVVLKLIFFYTIRPFVSDLYALSLAWFNTYLFLLFWVGFRREKK